MTDKEKDTTDQVEDNQVESNEPEADDAAVIPMGAPEETDVTVDVPESDSDEISGDATVEEAGEDAEDSGEATEEIIPLLPLKATVILPQTLVPLAAAQSRSLKLIDSVMQGDRMVAMVM